MQSVDGEFNSGDKLKLGKESTLMSLFMSARDFLNYYNFELQFSSFAQLYLLVVVLNVKTRSRTLVFHHCGTACFQSSWLQLWSVGSSQPSHYCRSIINHPKKECNNSHTWFKTNRL